MRQSYCVQAELMLQDTLFVQDVKCQKDDGGYYFRVLWSKVL